MGPLAAPSAQVPLKIRAGGEGMGVPGEALHVVRRSREGGLSRELAKGPGMAAYDGAAGGHGFEDGHAEAFIVTGKKEKGGLMIEGGEGLVVGVDFKADTSQGLGAGSERWGGRGAGEDERGLGQEGAKAGKDLEDPFAVFVRGAAADMKEKRGLGGRDGIGRGKGTEGQGEEGMGGATGPSFQIAGRGLGNRSQPTGDAQGGEGAPEKKTGGGAGAGPGKLAAGHAQGNEVVYGDVEPGPDPAGQEAGHGAVEQVEDAVRGLVEKTAGVPQAPEVMVPHGDPCLRMMEGHAMNIGGGRRREVEGGFDHPGIGGHAPGEGAGGGFEEGYAHGAEASGWGASVQIPKIIPVRRARKRAMNGSP